MGHTGFVVSPINKKRHDTGHPKCLVCALADVPAGAPLLKVYAYGPFGARFFVLAISLIDRAPGPTLGAACHRKTVWLTAHYDYQARAACQHQMLIEYVFASMMPASHPDNFQSDG